MKNDVEIAAIGYPTVRNAFNETLQLCVEKLSKTDLNLADEILGVDALDELSSGAADMLADTALYSSRGSFGAGTRRAIDRIAPKLPVKRDPLKAVIAAKLPDAIFSIFAVEGAHEQDGVIARDLLDNRPLHIMDQALAAQAAVYGEILLAGRFVNLGPWCIGFGIVVPLRKSEVLAIRLALLGGGAIETARRTLHELIYTTQLHGEDLVMTALEPVITALAMAVDEDIIDMDDLAAGLGSLLPSEPASKDKR